LAEGFGFSAAEACAIDKPVSVSNVGALLEVISGKHAFFELRNPQAIADGVEKVYKGKAEYRSKKVFSWDHCIGEYLEIYRRLLDDQ